MRVIGAASPPLNTKGNTIYIYIYIYIYIVLYRHRLLLGPPVHGLGRFVAVCVCEREREGGRDGGREGAKEGGRRES